MTDCEFGIGGTAIDRMLIRWMRIAAKFAGHGAHRLLSSALGYKPPAIDSGLRWLPHSAPYRANLFSACRPGIALLPTRPKTPFILLSYQYQDMGSSEANFESIPMSSSHEC